jgi:hypothetical protein
MSILAADAPDNHWHLQVGDPDALGWTITVAYFVVAFLCGRAAWRVRRARRATAPTPQATDARDGGGRPFDVARDPGAPWGALASGLVLLGLNKQLDLQILVRDVGLRAVHLAGLDEDRRWVGRAFVLALSAVVVGVMLTAARHLARARRRHRLLLLGLGMLAFFVVLRAGVYVPGLKQLNVSFYTAIHLVLELGSLILLGISAIRTRPGRADG